MGLTRTEFLDYIRAFNARDYATQHAFYADNVTLIIPDPAIGTLHGKKGIMDHYAAVHSFAEETVVPIVIMCEDTSGTQGRVFFMMESYFKYMEDTAHAVHSFKVKKGDVLKVTVWAYYMIDNKKMTSITCNLMKEEFLGQIDVHAAIRESSGRADPDMRIYADRSRL